MGDWISVEDRMPCYGLPVIVFTGVVQHATYFLDASDEEDCGWWECIADDMTIIPVNDVTHWMPLPLPPA